MMKPVVADMWRTVGHEAIVNLLQRSLAGGRLAHAYLFVGPPHVGKMTLALELAQAVNCLNDDRPCGECTQCQRIVLGQHADVQIVGLSAQESEGEERMRAEIGRDQVGEIQRAASLMPYEGRYRVFIFDGVERFSEEAANRLLKTLEEPPDNVLLLLLTSREEALLPTLISRCQRLELRPMPSERVAQELEDGWSVDPERAQELARLSGGCLGLAVEALSNPTLLEDRGKRLERIVAVVQAGLEQRFAYAAEMASLFFRDREAVQEELRIMLDLYRDLLLIKAGAREFATVALPSALEGLSDGGRSPREVVSGIKAILEASSHLEQNANPRLVLEDMMLSLPKP